MTAFIGNLSHFLLHRRSLECASSTWRMTSNVRQSTSCISRRAILSTAVATALANALSGTIALPADAKVDIDIERFGDKEVKQNVRNVLALKPELLPYFFTLTLYDGLTFNPKTNEGGPNGSLRLELDREVNKDLIEACDTIKSIQKLQRQTMSFADTCAFAGAVAVEVTGGPRIVVQLGREDAIEEDPASISSFYVPDASAADLKAVFDAAGLEGARDAVLFHGAVGFLNDVGQSRAAKLRESAIDDEDEDDADMDADAIADRDDVTYGRVQSKKRGAVLVETNVSLLTLGGEKFSNNYLKALLKAKDKSQLSKRDIVILDDKEMHAQVQKYADNNSKFVNDVADLYQKVSLLGSTFETMKFRD